MTCKPTIRTSQFEFTHFLDSAKHLLNENFSLLRIYFYAITMSGWDELASDIDKWKKQNRERTITAYVGTDHALTDPDALQQMNAVGVDVFLLRRYNGTFHPKLFWFSSKDDSHALLAGSNNLTGDGLTKNVEFALLNRFDVSNPNLVAWHEAIHSGSDRISDDLLKSYRSEKEKFGKARAKKGVAGAFTWSKRESVVTNEAIPQLPLVQPGDLILEVMPRETSTEGRQVQIPMTVAKTFFGLGQNRGDSTQISLLNISTNESKQLRLTHNNNSTARLSINELNYRDRPCIIVFRKIRRAQFSFEIVRQAIDPSRYKRLIRHCPQNGKRRWKVES